MASGAAQRPEAVADFAGEVVEATGGQRLSSRTGVYIGLCAVPRPSRRREGTPPSRGGSEAPPAWLGRGGGGWGGAGAGAPFWKPISRHWLVGFGHPSMLNNRRRIGARGAVGEQVRGFLSPLAAGLPTRTDRLHSITWPGSSTSRPSGDRLLARTASWTRRAERLEPRVRGPDPGHDQRIRAGGRPPDTG